MNDQQAKILLTALDPRESPSEERLWVDSPDGLPDRLAVAIAESAGLCAKLLLIGGRGLGKSATLRRVSRLLAAKGESLVVEIDLDRMGIGALSVDAFDLTYIIGVAILARLPAGKDRRGLGDRLKAAYAPDKEQRDKLGKLEEVIDGVAGFGATLALDGVLPGSSAAGPAAAALAKVALAGGVRLLSRSGPERVTVAESSAEGRGILSVTAEIAAAVRAAHRDRPIVVLLDGLEKVNGRGVERVRELFEYTQLLAQGAWSALIAAPPAVLSEATSLQSMGYENHPVFGFVDHPEGIRTLLRRRLEIAGGPLGELADLEALEAIVEASGGSPRSALWMAYYARREMGARRWSRLTAEAIEAGIARHGTDLNSGLTDDDKRILADVGRVRPSSERFSVLFASERILAVPPHRRGAEYGYRTHPLVAEEVRLWAAAGGGL